METIWTYLQQHGFNLEPRDAKHTVHLALESEKLNGAQKKRMAKFFETTEKLDGVYSLVTVIPVGTEEPLVRHWGRSGKAQSNCEVLDNYVASQLLNKAEKRKIRPMILISEVTSSSPLAVLSGYLTPSRVNEVQEVPHGLQDNFHDVITIDEFIRGKSDMTYYYRMIDLDNILYHTQLLHVPMFGTMTFEQAKDYAEKNIYPRGAEGLILADIHKQWVAGARNESLMKIKEKLSYDVTVIGMCSGKEGSKYENTLGKLLVAFPLFGNKDNEYVVIPISGMKDSQRDYWWTHPEDIIGLTVKMDAKSFTEPGNLREPRFKEVRNDKESQFPVDVLCSVTESTKGKAKWFLNDWSKR